MNNAPSILKACTENLLETLKNFKTQNLEEILSFEIDCEGLSSFPPGRHGSDVIFSRLHNFNNDRPAVYWFEIISNHSAKDIRDAYPDIQTRVGLRKTPAVYRNQKFESKVLYVGKGKANISGRMFLHFGYEPKKFNLQGLQLCHWDYTESLKGLKLKLNIIYLPMGMEVFVPIFEKQLADSLKPILGKHQ